MFRAEKLSSWSVVALCAYAPLIVFVAGNSLYRRFEDCTIGYMHIPYDLAPPSVLAAEVAGRYTWLASVFMMTGICALAFVYFLYRVSLTRSMGHYVHVIMITLGGVALFSVYHLHFVSTKLFQCHGTALLDNVKQTQDTHKGLYFETIGSAPFLKNLPLDLIDLASAVELIVAVAAMAISVGVAMLVVVPDQSQKDDVDSLAEKMSALRNYLYLAALGLVSGLMAVRSFFRWPEQFVLEDGVAGAALRADFIAHADAMVMYQSAVYVVLLAVLFGIPSSILAARARALAAGGLEKEGKPVTFSAVRSWLTENKLSASFTDQVAQIGAILSPALFGSLSDLLQAVAL